MQENQEIAADESNRNDNNNDNDSTHEDDVDSIASDETPLHPVPAMQEAFEESIREATDTGDSNFKSSPDISPEARRRELLDRPEYDASWITRWKQKPGARCHPIVKLMSQIIFGLHLLHQQQARSESEVVKILQVHVDDIDGFLAKTTEDFDLAIKDIEERISFLKLPMSHMEVFETMLDDRKFRCQLVEGNEKIEQIIDRTAKAMNAVMLDIQKALNTTQQLAEYLQKVDQDWPHECPDSSAVFMAMKGNELGWKRCLRDLQEKGNQLGVALVRLGTVVGEMNKLAASASRRAPARSPPSPEALYPSNDRKPRPSADSGRDKPLPKEPDAAGAAVKATIGPASSSSSAADKRPKPEPIKTLAAKTSTPLMNRGRSNEPKRPRPLSVQLSAPTSPLLPQTSMPSIIAKTSKSSLRIPSNTVQPINTAVQTPLTSLRETSEPERKASNITPTSARGSPASLGVPVMLPIASAPGISGTGLSQSLPSEATNVPMPGPLQVSSKRSHSRSRSGSRSTSNTIYDTQKTRHARQSSNQTSISQSTVPSISTANSSRAPSHYSRPSVSSSIGDTDFSFNAAIDPGSKTRSASQSRNPSRSRNPSHSRNPSNSMNSSHSRNTSQPTSLSGFGGNPQVLSNTATSPQATQQPPIITIQRDTTPSAAMEEAVPESSQELTYEEIIIQPPSMFLPPITPIASFSQTLPPTQNLPAVPSTTQTTKSLQTEAPKLAPRPPPLATAFDPRAVQQQMQDSTSVLPLLQKAEEDDPDLTLMGNSPSRQRQELIRSKTDSAYVLDSDEKIKAFEDSPPLTATRIPSKLGLFPVTSTPSLPPVPPPAAPRPKPSVTFEKNVVTLPPINTIQNTQQKSGRLGKLFKRKAKEDSSFIRVSPN
ncbi:hypothetical protein K461DRAFT_292238 [Myriangium duriaei CBS 260.36]|uniref:Uncharacterized protein n=1 Tax=Myriangium duriaei CBS 260.36 TaxID=1168546 RepID=A0A9P4J5C2_9PEZI|nr:hypothetical protein K461DRAFT_292238 [Myriangium duriaei CBS 260.36]